MFRNSKCVYSFIFNIFTKGKKKKNGKGGGFRMGNTCIPMADSC